MLGNDKHVVLDLVLSQIGHRAARRLHLFLSLVAAVSCFIVTWFGILTVIDQFQNDIRRPTITAPLTFWITAVIPFGFVLLGVQFVRRGLRAAMCLTLAVGPLTSAAAQKAMEWWEAFLVIMGALFDLMFIGLPVAFAFLVINLIGGFIFFGRRAGDSTTDHPNL